MAENNIPEELAGVQTHLEQLEQIMGSADDGAKKRIFNQVICRMAEALPEVSPEKYAMKEPEPIPAHTKNLMAAADKLREAAYLAEFIQSISLNANGGGLLLQPGQVTGFYYAMENTIDRIKEAEALIDAARKEPEAQPA
jgi:hypothetical protein